MAHVLRPLIQWPRWRHHHSTIYRLLTHRPPPTHAAANPPHFAFISNSFHQAHFRSGALKLRDGSSLSGGSESDDDFSDGIGTKKSRNERKREAHRAVRWGMDLASFSPPQIKRILRAADIEQDVFDAIMVVKRLGRDVREGKRRQFNYIGRLLRDSEPEPGLMDELIKATKDGDHGKFQDFLGADLLVSSDVEEERELSEDEEEESSISTNVVTRWYDGLVNKDISVTNEIYSLREVEFDRQELRQLVRKVQSAVEEKANLEENEKPGAAGNAGRSLTRFLHVLAKQLHSV